MIKLPSLLFAALCLAGCDRDRDFPVERFDTASLTLSLYSIDGEVTCTLERNSPQYDQLRAWVIKNQQGWQFAPATYLPGKVVSGSGFRLNFLDTMAILDYSGGQFALPVEPDEYAFLSCT
ncbi:MAG: hypothetical protein LBE21_02710 [Pseudomonadales bacterium]|jgi:hypothetical protein|nr:hypothetical protein [Pseudomonadales bacterium]